MRWMQARAGWLGAKSIGGRGKKKKKKRKNSEMCVGGVFEGCFVAFFGSSFLGGVLEGCRMGVWKG